MRIDAYNSISKIYQTSSKSKVNAKKNTGINDTLEFSDIARNYQVAKQAVSEAPDIREDKVSEIKAMMANGTYSVSSSALAEKLLNRADEISF